MNSKTSELSSYYNIKDYASESDSVNYDSMPLSVDKKYTTSKSISGFRKLAKNSYISEYTYTDTESEDKKKQETIDSASSPLQDTIKKKMKKSESESDNLNSDNLPNELPQETIASPDPESNYKEAKNAFYTLFGETGKKHTSGYEGHNIASSMNTGNVMGQLPEGYSGQLPDHLQAQMGPQMGMPQMGMPQMPPQMPPQMGMPPQMPPQMGMQQMPQFSDAGYSIGTATSEMQQSINPASLGMGMPQQFNNLSIGTATSEMQQSINPSNLGMNMPPQFSDAGYSLGTATSPMQSINTAMEPGMNHTSLLPSHMMMNQNQSMNMNSIGSASAGMPNIQQRGGSKKRFFFSRGEEKR